MKIIYLITILSCINLYSQKTSNYLELKPMQKAIIKIEKSNSNYSFSVLSIEPYNEIVDAWDNENIFKPKGEKETLEICFCKGKDQDKELKILFVQSRSKYSFTFDTEIQLEIDGEFKSVPNVGSHTKSKTIETWEWDIRKLRISNLKIKQ